MLCIALLSSGSTTKTPHRGVFSAQDDTGGAVTMKLSNSVVGEGNVYEVNLQWSEAEYRFASRNLVAAEARIFLYI